MSKYTDFVKANYHKVKKFPNKQRFKELGKMWRSHKDKMVKKVKKENKVKKPKKVQKKKD